MDRNLTFTKTAASAALKVNLRSLIFGLQFNQSIEQLSRKWSSLQTLSFGEHFDQSRVTWCVTPKAELQIASKEDTWILEDKHGP